MKALFIASGIRSDASNRAIGPAIVVPLAVRRRVFGALRVHRAVGAAPFRQADVRLVEGFAAQASAALEYSRARDDLQRLAVVEERERIARDLHDGVIQSLFGIGLDNADGHKRISKTEEFLLVGGSQETHENMQDIALRFSESLRDRGKRLEEASPEEVIDLLHDATD